MIVLYGLKAVHAQANFKNFQEFSRLYSANTGNAAFVFALHEVLKLGGASKRWSDPATDLSQNDTLLLPLANHIGGHVDMSKMLAGLDRDSAAPIVVNGLGAQLSLNGDGVERIPAGTWDMIAYLTTRAAGSGPNITVRGAKTHALLAEKGFEQNIVKIGCQSNFLSVDPALGQKIRTRIAALKSLPADGLKIAVPAGNPTLPQFRKLEQSLAGLVERNGGLYVVQGPPDLLKLSLGFSDEVGAESLATMAQYIIGSDQPETFEAWMRRHSIVFTNVPDWMRYYRTCDAVVGTRIHGCVLAIQAGVPAVCLVIDSRTKELCEQMDIPYADARAYRDGIETAQILDILQNWDPDRYDRNRRQLAAEYGTFMQANRIPISSHLRTLAG